MGDVRDTVVVTKALQDCKVNALIHFAGLKAVGESSSKPIEYYSNNVAGTISILDAMSVANIKNLIFSSNATVYGPPELMKSIQPVQQILMVAANYILKKC